MAAAQRLLCICLTLGAGGTSAGAADMTVQQVSVALASAAHEPVDFSTVI